MPTCNNSCEPEVPPLPPIFDDPEEIPDAISQTITNLDVLLNHIIHKVGSDNPIVPDPADIEASTSYMTDVVTPIVIQVLAEDVVPALPVCQFPGGEPFYMGDGSAPVNDNATLPDVNDLLNGALDATIAGLIDSDLPEHAKDVLEGLDTEQILENLMIMDENGEPAVEVIVA